MRRAALLTLLLLAAPVQADDLGRLFFSAAERARLDAERLAPPAPPAEDIAVTRDAAADIPVDAPLTPSPPVTVNGLVLRAHGPSTAWINGAPSTRRELATGEGRELRIGRDAVEVRDPLASARVKPGQTFEPDAGRVVEGFARPPTAAPDSP